jgi:Sulfotransferase family
MESRQAPKAVAHGTGPKVLYVGAFARSGSTLVGRVLGEAPDAMCVGETRYLWSRGLLNNVQCGCGRSFRSCSFWDAVGREAFGGWDRVDAEWLAEVDHTTNGPRTLPLHWIPSLCPDFTSRVKEYVSHLTRLYAAIARVSGATTIIDTSKDPNFASLLTYMPSSDVRIIHLVRDSRAVAYSWTRNKQLSSPIGDQKFMERFKPLDTAPRWLAWNAAFHIFAARRAPYMRVSYESFVETPRDILCRFSLFADESLVLSTSQLTDKKVKLGRHHIFSGNPMSDRTGWLEIGLDDEWQTMLPTRQFAQVTAITLPLLRLYGYPIVPAARRSLMDPRPRLRQGAGA